MSAIAWIYSDGGRAFDGFRGKARGDCAARALAIATGMQYRTAYEAINAAAASERTGKRKRGKSSASSGVYKATFARIMANLGWIWTPTMGIGTGCRVHLRADELPRGRLIVNLSKHYAAVIDGELFDTHDCSRGGTRCVYGYWSQSTV